MITSGLVTLVLEEDGTVVDTEEFFQTLGDNTHFMILEKGQKWTPVSKSAVIQTAMGRLFTYKSAFPTLVLTCPISKYILCIHLITGFTALKGFIISIARKFSISVHLGYVI